MPTTPNMNMQLPTVQVTTDPDWATQLNDALTDAVDTHDHTSGKGVQVPTAGLNINADLSLQSNDLTTIRSLALNNNISTLPLGDVRAIYASGGNLYYNNNSGNPIQITSGSSLNTGALALNVWELQELAGNLTILTSDSFVFINVNTASTRTITLPAANGVTAGRYYIIKDKTGSANTNNITITPAGSDTIDGAASSTTVSSSYGSVTLVSDGVGGWLTNAAISGFLQLGGDLLGTGSTVAAPRVSGLTGISGLVTMANNTALNSRNAANDTNIGLAKVNTSNQVRLGDDAFDGYVDGSNLVLSTTGVLKTEGNPSSITLTSTGTNTLSSSGGAVSISSNTTTTIAATTAATVSAATTLTLDGYTTNITATDAASITAATTLTLDGYSLSFIGKMLLPAKAVTTTPYTVDTTTKDYVVLIDTAAIAGAVTINLPAAQTGRVITFKDVGGSANTYNITLTRVGGESIEGVAANYVMDADYQAVTLACYGSDWFIVGTA